MRTSIAVKSLNPRTATEAAPSESDLSAPARFEGPGSDWQTLAFSAAGVLPVMPKLSVSQPDDPREREADRVADEVMRMPVGLSATPVYRMCSECQDEVQRSPLSPVAPSSWHGSMGLSSGTPLSDATRGFFEPRFGTDFSGVRVHADTNADHFARKINARAFTVGSDIGFRYGEYAPESLPGRRLLAHELTHVVQGGGGGADPGRIHRQLWGPSTHHIPVEDLTWSQRLNEAMVPALYAFGAELLLCRAILLLSLVVIATVLSLFLGWLEGILSAAAFAFVQAGLALGGLSLGAIFGIAGVMEAHEAWTEFDSALQSASSREDLERAGTRFGQRMARAVTELLVAVLSVFGGWAGVRGLSARGIRFSGRGSGRGSAGRGSTGSPNSPATPPPAQAPPAQAPAAGAAGAAAEGPTQETILLVIQSVRGGGNRPPTSRLIRIATRIKQAIHREAGVRGRPGDCVEGWCGQNGRLIPDLLREMGLSNAENISVRMVNVRGEGGGSVHGFVVGETAEGTYFIFDAAVEQFTIMPRIMGPHSSANPSFTAAAQESGHFIQALHGRSGLAFFSSEQALQRALGFMARLAPNGRLGVLRGAGNDVGLPGVRPHVPPGGVPHLPESEEE